MRLQKIALSGCPSGYWDDAMPILSSIACTVMQSLCVAATRIDYSCIYRAFIVSWYSTFVARRSSSTGISTMSSTDARPSTLPML